MSIHANIWPNQKKVRTEFILNLSQIVKADLHTCPYIWYWFNLPKCYLNASKFNSAIKVKEMLLPEV